MLKKKTNKVLTCGEFDRRRRRGLMSCRVMAALSFLVACLFALGVYYILVISLWASIAFLSGSVSLARVRSCLLGGRRLWHANDLGVVMEVPRDLVMWELVEWVLMTLGIPGAVLVRALGGNAVAVGFFAGAGIYGSMHIVCILWNGGMEVERILLHDEGVRFTWSTGGHVSISWLQRPAVIGASWQGALIEAAYYPGRLEFPMGYVPMSCRQLQRLLDAFSNDPGLQASLRSPEALTAVLDVLEPTEEEYSDPSWTWARPEVSKGGA